MNPLDKTLELFGALEAGDATTKAAQGRLEAAVAKRAPAPIRAKRSVGGWLAAGASAMAAVLAVVFIPLASTPALAFSAVQEHFRDFRTLRFDMVQRVPGQPDVVTHVATTRDGRSRTDVGKDVSVIANIPEGRVITLIHQGKLAMEIPLNAQPARDDSLEWVEDIKTFQGAAQRLPGSRTIDGRTAYGWRLAIAEMDVVLWATEEGLPLEMQMHGAAEMRFDFHFEFDAALPSELFSTAIPVGYRRAEAED
jgi:hypothetical protein